MCNKWSRSVTGMSPSEEMALERKTNFDREVPITLVLPDSFFESTPVTHGLSLVATP
jgi:hypothetical protein